MQNPLPYPENSHFTSDFARGVTQDITNDVWPNHWRGQSHQHRAIDRGLAGGELRPTLFHYLVPDGDDPLHPIPAVGDRIYVARWMPGETFAGGWMFASNFGGLGSLAAQWSDANAETRTLLLANGAGLSPNTDFTTFEIDALYERNPAGQVIDLFFELSAAPSAGDVLKGRLDFVT